MLEIASAIVVIAAGITLILVLVGLVVLWFRERNLPPEEKERRMELRYGMDKKAARRWRWAFGFKAFAYLFVLGSIVVSSWQGAQQRQGEVVQPTQQQQATQKNQWQTYRSEEYGIQFQYPSTYSVTPFADERPCFLVAYPESSCVTNLTIAANGNSYAPMAYLYVVEGINSVTLSGQTMQVKFDAEREAWIWSSDTLSNTGDLVQEQLEVWSRTTSGKEIIKTSTGGSHASFVNYVIPDYAKDIAVVFQIPSARRLRCDMIQEASEKDACETFFTSVVEKYNQGQGTIDDWIPGDYFKALYADAEDMIATIQFVEPIDISTWQTYRNEEFGFEFKYPAEWTVEDKSVVNPATGSSFAVVFNGNPNNLSLDEWFTQATLVGGRPTTKAAAERVTINGIPAYNLETGLAPPNPLFEVVAIANKQNTIFSIYAHYGVQEDAAILNQMLSTFRFLGFTVLSPNGGEELVQGEEYEIRWTSTFPETEYVSIYLVSRKCWEENCFTDAIDFWPDWPDAIVIVPQLKQRNTGSFVWKVPILETFMYYPYTPEEAKEVEAYSEAPPGEYKIVVMRNYEVKYGRTYDESDEFFTVVSNE